MKLKKYLQTEGISYQQFAEKLGVHKMTVYSWVRKKRRKTPSPEKLVKIVKITGGKVRYADFYED